MQAPSINDPGLADVLQDLAARVGRLAPSHRDPEAFHEAKSEIAADLRRLSRVLPTSHVCGRQKRLTSLHLPGFEPKLSERE